MQLHRAHEAVTQTIDAIVKKGGQKLYDSYINQKLPNHTSEQASHIIDKNISVPFMYTTLPMSIKKQTLPQGELKETIIPNKIRKIKLQQGNNEKISDLMVKSNLGFRINLEQKNKKSTDLGLKRGAETERIHVRKFKPKIRQKGQNHLKSLINPEQQRIRQEQHRDIKNQKQKQLKLQQKNLAEQIKIKNEKMRKTRRLREHFEQINVLGMPFAYDDDAKIYSPDPRQFKAKRIQLQRRIDHRNNKILGLKHQTLDLGVFERYVKDVKQLVGRKRGYFSTQFYKKAKMTNEEYNNQNSRQNTNVPFVNLSEGVKIIERQRNVVVQKNKKQTTNLEQYKQKNQYNFFKSFVPDYDYSSLMQTMDVERPNTTGKFNRTKKTSQTTMSKKMKNSILWRPFTTSKNCRMNITNQSLAKQFIEIEDD